MTQPLDHCPGCAADEPFEQVHPGACPDVDGECPEWACAGCGAGVIMGTDVFADADLTITPVEVAVGQSVRAA